MMNNGSSGTLVREIAAIMFMSIVLAFLYNAFSPKGLSLLRTPTDKVAVNDSLLFSPQPKRDTIASDPGKIADDEKKDSSHKGSSVVATFPGKVHKKSSDTLQILSLTQVQQLLNKRRALFIDARDPDAYKKAHIPGAINVFGDEPEKHFEELTTVSPDTLIVAYCNGPDCHLGRSLISFLKMMEFKRLYLYDDGWDGWEKAKMPVEKSQEK